MLSSCCLFLLHFALWLEFRWPSQNNQSNINGGRGLCLAPMLHSLILLSATQGSLFPWQHILLSLFKPPRYFFSLCLALTLITISVVPSSCTVRKSWGFSEPAYGNSQVMLMDLSTPIFSISLDQTPLRQFRAFTENHVIKQISNHFV